MKQLIILPFVVVLGFNSCSKINNDRKEKIFANDSIVHEYYQKDIPYEGLKGGHIDSVASKVYNANKKELTNIGMKHFNIEGYIISDEYKSYISGELLSVKHISYVRDQSSLVSYRLENYLTNRGEGYTKQYKLISREFNKEIWEYMNKMPYQTLALAAEIREYSEFSLKVFSQVGNTDSTTLSIQYNYSINGAASNIYYYYNNKTVNSIQTEHNSFDLPIRTIKKSLSENNIETTHIEKFEYLYDDNNNPIEIKVYRNNELQQIIENTIYYNN